jgi:hypothetical protein
MRHRLNGPITTIGGVSALIGGLAIIDERVREQLRAIVEGRPPSGEIVSAGARLKELGWVMADAVRDQSIEHAPMTVFVLAAAVLLFFMLKT